MFVTLYDKTNKEQIAFMVEMECVPCIGDGIMIEKKHYKVVDRLFATDKLHRCCCYVEKRK